MSTSRFLIHHPCVDKLSELSARLLHRDDCLQQETYRVHLILLIQIDFRVKMMAWYRKYNFTSCSASLALQDTFMNDTPPHLASDDRIYISCYVWSDALRFDGDKWY